MPVQIFDDGTQLVTDTAGNVVTFTDTSGARFAPDTSVMDRFLNTVLGGIQASINKRYGTPAGTIVYQPGQPGYVVASIMPLLLLAGAAFVVYQLIKK